MTVIKVFLQSIKLTFLQVRSESKLPMEPLLEIEENVISHSKLGRKRFHYQFLYSGQLSQDIILGYYFAKTYHIGTCWNANDVMSLTLNGTPFAETIPTHDVNALLSFVLRALSSPHIQMAIFNTKCQRVKRTVNHGKTCVFEPSFRHRSIYTKYTIYEGIVTIEDDVVKSGTFNIVMTNRSNKHIKVYNNQTMGMLRSCQDEQICSIHRMVTFNKIEKRGRKTNCKPIEKNLYLIPTRDEKTGKTEMNTLLKKGRKFSCHIPD